MPLLSSPAMVGRDAELAELAGVLRDAVGGDTRAVLLGGDAGVGKTRLLRALADHARAEGWRVLAGHCLDFGDSALPYLPVSEIIGRLDDELPDVVAEVAAAHAALARLRPGRRTAGPGGPSEGTDDDVRRSGDAGSVLVAVQALTEALAAREPVLLVLEDLHWADPSTRDLLGFLLARSSERPFVVVASYRSDDLHRRHPLRRSVAEWGRLPGVARLSLAPLPDADVRDLVVALAPSGVASSDVEHIVARAEGNAFFVEELVAAGGATGGDDVPADLADLLLLRLDRLGDDARDVVRVASVAGRRVEHALLAATVDLPAPRLEAALREAVESNLLQVRDTRYSFRHALVGDAVYDDLLPGERVRLHARYVDAITSGAAPGTAAEIARHARRANDLDRAATASLAAGDEASVVGGPDEAARHYQQVLELVEDDARAARLGIDVSKIVVKVADAMTIAGDGVRAARLLADRLQRLPSEASDVVRARLLAEYADALARTESPEDPVAVVLDALALAPAGDSPLRAKILATAARLHSTFRPTMVEEAEAMAAEALGLAERLAMPLLASEAVTTISALRQRTATGAAEDDLRRALRAAVEGAEASGAFAAEMRGRYLLGRSYQNAGEAVQAEEWFVSVVERGRRAGAPWAPFVMEARWQAAWVRHQRGDFDGVLALAAELDDPVGGPQIPRAIVEPARLAVLAARGTAPDEVLARLAALRPLWSDEGGIAVHAAGVAIDVHAHAGEAAAALAVLDDVVGVLSRIWLPRFGGLVRLVAQTMAAFAVRLPAAGSVERRDLAVRADRLRADSDRVVERYADGLAVKGVGAGSWGLEGRMWEARVEAEHLRVRWLADVDPPTPEQLVEAWDDALRAVRAFGHVPEEARVLQARAQVLRAAGRASSADDDEQAAAGILGRLGVPVAAGRPARPRGSRPGSADLPVGPSSLTPRELEVLDLVAQGRTNGEIGRALFISTKTVSVHVSNVLAKLGAAGRTEAAAIARREGLLD